MADVSLGRKSMLPRMLDSVSPYHLGFLFYAYWKSLLNTWGCRFYHLSHICIRSKEHISETNCWKGIAGKTFKLPGSEFKASDLALTQPSMSVLSSKGLSLMPPRTIAVPGSLQALLTLTPSYPPSASQSANSMLRFFSIYQVLAVEALQTSRTQLLSSSSHLLVAVWGLPLCSRNSQEA